MESANAAASSIGDSVSRAAASADSASQSESSAATYAQNASDAADRVGTAEQVGTWAQQAQDAADRIGTAETVEGWANSARDSASAAEQSASKSKEYRDTAASAASTTADSIRSELRGISNEASGYATDASMSAARAKTSETNAATHEASSLSAAERAEFAAEETIQQVEGDFATRNYVDQRAPLLSFADTGSPEGKVTAPVGSVYTDSAATNGAIRWIKTSGTGNTGWRVEYGDTGVRSLPRPEIFTGGVFRVSRTGDYVQLVIHAATLTSALPAWQPFITLPPGFRTATSFRVQAQDAFLDVVDNGRLAQIGTNVPAGKIVSFGAVYRTNDPWPTSLPGTPN